MGNGASLSGVHLFLRILETESRKLGSISDFDKGHKNEKEPHLTS